ncbi:GTP-binding protein [Azospirillum sp. YIM B02556]|uniref:GTP-binding protein n=1 Tax=Azospirillum endophyticum TaxID=2800326 RepID=A0ABS1FEX3_9PROT|nr:CobW family GTP-binding protein [Azospirillum endophyticum]MBK1841947.1 GTP-binding protein [Azospirillum endophyticum]
MDDDLPADPVPVMLVTGVLGSGKTTLINHILNAAAGRRFAAIVNDFGAINIDEAILSASGRSVIGLKNGCICCSLQGDLLRTLRTILSHKPRVDGIVIEASGISDPRGIVAALFDPVLRDAVGLDSVVTVVDAEEHDVADGLWRTQIEAADFVVLSKADRVSDKALLGVRTLLHAMRKRTVFVVRQAADIPFDILFGNPPEQIEGVEASLPLHPAGERFVKLEWTSEGPVSLPAFQSGVQSFAAQLARGKGFLTLRERPGERFLFQLVGTRASLLPTTLPAPGSGPGSGVQLVFIGREDRFDARLAKAALDAIRLA